jgi:hypothetical protein
MPFVLIRLAREFLHEIQRPRLAPLVGGLLTVGAVLVIADHRLTLESLRNVPLSAVLGNETDGNTRAIWVLAARRDTNGPSFIAIGGSVLWRALDDEPAILERFHASGVDKVPYVPLLISNETLTETLALLTTLEAPAGSVVVANMSPMRLSMPVEVAESEARFPRLPLLDYSEVLRLLAEQGHIVHQPPELWRLRGWLSIYLTQRLGEALYDCAHRDLEAGAPFACASRLLIASRRRVTSLKYRTYPDTALPIELKRTEARELSLQLLAQEHTVPLFGEAVARRIEDVCRRRGWRIVWVRLPVDPLARNAEQFLDHNVDETLDLPRQGNTTELDLRVMPFGSSDFIDLHHLRAGGASIVTDSIVARVTSILRTTL